MITVLFYLHLLIDIYANHTYILNDSNNNDNHNVKEQHVNRTTFNNHQNDTDDDDDSLLWLQWKILHHKNYSTYKEYNEHRENWRNNLYSIKKHNSMHDQGLELYTTGLNQFSDLNWSDINALYLTNLSQYSTNRSHQQVGEVLLKQPFNETTPLKEIPNSWDWRKLGIVSKVKLQGECGACWAFSAAGALEGQLRNKTGSFVELSSQQLIDCSHSFGNHGCLGGEMKNAFRYVEKDGIQTEESYPYLTKESKCQHSKSTSLTYSKSIIEIELNNEEQLKTVLYEHGPVSAGINVEPQFIRYKNGIYQSQSCSSTDVNHAVLIVGFGEENGIQYWIVKNSWGTSWGEDGYVRIRRNYNNMCGIATMASVPKL
ncbi:unnamed protein product [Schistosoma turkestanicum]|nr:unnamed protein product [Schistosoma turkestanicum]